MSYRSLGYKEGRTRLLPQSPDLAATTVQIGFYRNEEEPLGGFSALLYLQLEENIDGLLAELEGFFLQQTQSDQPKSGDHCGPFGLAFASRGQFPKRRHPSKP